MLGYILDQGWGRVGGQGEMVPTTQVILGESVRPGPVWIAWWDADTGLELARTRLDHTGGRLSAACPAFRRHIAFKLWRDE
jgi:hypothetical protein